jgi:predicted glycoside hydrolase/deacetylase ChbG (UPF0249 family)
MTRAIVARSIPLERVAAEWRAQIERCMECGLQPRFLNSHEHLHMLPALFRLVMRLADEFGIPHVRFTTGRLGGGLGPGAGLRSALITALATINRRRTKSEFAAFLGLETSGRLDLGALDAATAGLNPGGVHELMCHPGRLDPGEVIDRRLLAYHDWEGELAALTDPRARALLEERGVRLIGYRHVTRRDGRLVAAPALQRSA